jgi:hypothetical protein
VHLNEREAVHFSGLKRSVLAQHRFLAKRGGRQLSELGVIETATGQILYSPERLLNWTRQLRGTPFVAKHEKSLMQIARALLEHGRAEPLEDPALEELAHRGALDCVGVDGRVLAARVLTAGDVAVKRLCRGGRSKAEATEMVEEFAARIGYLTAQLNRRFEGQE